MFSLTYRLFGFLHTGVWMWVDGSNHSNQRSIVDLVMQYPGARQGPATWVDPANNVWMYGGEGFTGRKSGYFGALEDLWVFGVKQKKWRMLGPSTSNFLNKTVAWPPPCRGCIACSFQELSVVYMRNGKSEKIPNHTWLYNMSENVWHPLKHADHDNKTSPSPRQYPAYWCDSNSGILWIFGGSNMTSKELLQDMWKFTFKTKRWEKINFTRAKQSSPIARFGASTWRHPLGDLYLFGGKSTSGSYGFMADLWLFSIKTLTWKSLTTNENKEGTAGIYGTLGVSSPRNIPGGRKGGATWIDSHGCLWLFGGSGYDANAKGFLKMSGLLSDFWLYNISINTWMWVGGSKRGEGMPQYGVQGRASGTNIPGPRENAVTFKYENQFWMFGGGGHDVSQRDGLLNDVWVFTPKKSEHHEKLPGDTINLPFVYKLAISLAVAFMVIVLCLAVCYKKECMSIFHKPKKYGFKVKYEPVKVKMQVPSVTM